MRQTPQSRQMATAVTRNCIPRQIPVHHGPKEPLPKLMLGAIGVVYGDIGTSPLYTMKESFLGPHPLAVDQRTSSACSA